MPGTRLLTLLQISDLHLGHIDPVNGDADYSPAMVKLFSNFSLFDGLLGHHSRGLTDLEAFYKQLAPETPELLVTGDQTRVGDPVEFDNADDYLYGRIDLNPPNGRYAGLKHANWRDYAIPGNHDHWPGTPTIWGGPTAALATYFPTMPYVRPTIPLNNGRLLQIAGIDTDADVYPKGPSRARALGHFQSQLNALAPKLGLKKPEHIRILLLHHSWEYTGFTLSLGTASRAALAHFLVNHGIQVVLTGHIHTVHLGTFQPVKGQPHTVLECRSGTTTQADQVPYSWHTAGGGFPTKNWPANALFVHRLREESGQTFWDVETFVRSKGSGFLTAGQGGQASIAV